jgi:hypothetical protein
MRRYVLPILLTALIAACLTAVVVWNQARGVRVTVINGSLEPLAAVMVHVTGNEHAIGRLAPGESHTVRVSPTSESHVEIAFVDHAGRAHRLNASGYFEPGYHGTIEVEIEGGAIKRNEQSIGVSLF